MSEKIDFKKTLESYKASKGKFVVLDVPATSSLMIDGHGDPNTSQDFVDAVQALYPVSYKLKFASKIELGRDYVVPPLEGLWWADDMSAFTTARDKSQWNWTMMTMVPDWIEVDMFETAVDVVRRKNDPKRLDHVRLEALAEGLCVQTLHVGSFDDEATVLAELHDVFVPSLGLVLAGKHHEIYLSDFRKVEPSKQRTILRQPVERRN
jgi:hypothetical protein